MTKKIVAIVVAVILVIGISAGTTLLVGKKDVPVDIKVEDGLSAYELAVQFGYEGTVQEWIESLEGKSAYQIAVDSGYKGTESEWLASLKASSDNTANIKNAKFNSTGELILTLSDDTTINLGVAVGANGKDGAAGKDGKDGQNGTPGKDGVDGKDGVSISEASINGEGQLILTFTDGKSFNLDKVVGAKGEAGIGIANSKINEQGELVLTYSNGQEANLGKVLGAAGNDGQDGAPGKDGNAIISTVINNSGELVITYSNGTSDNLGVVVGKDGKNGADGKDGVNGTNGKDGVDGKDGVSVSSAQINSSGELVLTYSNGQISTLGKVIGADGKDGVDGEDGKDGADGKDGVNGTNGKDGKDGISIAKSEINSKGELVITYSNNEVENLGIVVGANGRDGVNGADGKDGVNGADGKDGVDGEDGKDGKDGVGIEDIKIVNGNLAITLTNGTTMDLGNIKGADGKDGTNGTNGKDGTDGKNGADGADGKDGISVTGAEINAANELVLTFSDGTDKNLGVVVGADGKEGANGTDGVNGTDGRGIKKTEVNAIGELVVTYTDDTTDNLGVIISDNGGAGTGAIAPRIQINASTNEWEISTDGGETYVSTGVKATGADGKDGADGEDGKDGANGISVTGAIINNEKELVLIFSDGTEKNLGVVVGADGKDGADGEDGKDGINGTNGADGKDGEKGEDGTDGKDGVGISGAAIESDNHLVLTLSNGDTIDVGVVVGADGKNGVDGADGKNGADGKDGKNGVGIKNVTVSEEGILTVTLDNDTIFTLGNIRGKDGIGIAKTEINTEGKLVITYTDNKVVTLDKVVGANGVGIKSAEITKDYMLKLVFTDNGTQEVGPIRGEKGADGVGITNVSVGDDGYLYVTYSNSDEAQKIAYIKGDKGDTGADGKTGVGVANSYVDENLHLWIVLSDGTKIDAGYVGVTTGGGSTITKYTVVFKDYDGTVLKTEEVESGKSATAPANPTRNGYEFAGWSGSYTNVTSNVEIIATYVENNNPMLGVSNANATAGATKVTLTVSLKNNPGFLTMALKTTFNSDALTLTKVTTGIDFMDYSFTAPKNKISGCTAAWFASDLPEEIIDGDIMTLQFTVNANATPGRYPVTISCPDDGSTVDGNKEAFNMSDAIGYITIE